MKNNPSKKTLGSPTPLGIISLFISLTELVIGATILKTEGEIQFILVMFAIIFPSAIALLFFFFLWQRAEVFYSPSEYAKTKDGIEGYRKGLNRTRYTQPTNKTSDLATNEVKVIGNPDQFKLLFKATGPNWMKSTKAMEVDKGCVLQVTTEHQNDDGSSTAAEAVVFIPDAYVEKDEKGDGYSLCARDKQI